MDVADKHKVGKDGILEDGISSHQATNLDFEQEAMALASLSSLTVPRMFDGHNAHSRLFVSVFDGTGNDAVGDPEHVTNPYRIYEQEKGISRLEPRIAADYVKGPGTQKSLVPRTFDGALGYSYDARLEEMYQRFVRKAAEWISEDPMAEIHVLETGFSRGADEAIGFARMLQERGIRDPDGRTVVRDAHGHAHVAWAKPPLREPGQTLQHALLFDPVGTGHPQRHDRRLPPSMVSAFQIVARDERRNQFPSTQIVPQGLSPDGRFLGVTVPGAHSDIGGSYHLDGAVLVTPMEGAGTLQAVDFLDIVRNFQVVDRASIRDTDESTEGAEVD